ncbi:hypothetical protein [Armatimonas sp.]|uniref:hypothetical protein n=1 Tax=Armatimonas sp. TaxID=1872638 RepID=UPI0037506239
MGELLVGWFLLVCGAVAVVATVTQVTEYLRHGEGAFFLVFTLLSLQSNCCLLGGLSSLLRYHAVARWLLTAGALCSVGMALWLGYDYYLSRHYPQPPGSLIEITLFAFAFLAFAGLLYFLGWWLGRQEDSEA